MKYYMNLNMKHPIKIYVMVLAAMFAFDIGFNAQFGSLHGTLPVSIQSLQPT